MKILALIVNIVGIAAIIGSAMMAIMSPMIFDAPKSAESRPLWIIFWCLLLLPIILIVCEVLGWRYYFQGNYTSAVYIYKWALLDLVLIAILLKFV